MEVDHEEFSHAPLIDGLQRAYELTFDSRPEYLYALIKCDRMDRNIALEYLTKVAEKVSELKQEKLMLVRDVPVMLPDSDLFFTTQYFLDRIGRTKVAFVNPHAVIEEDMKFAIVIGTNRGANYELFREISEAEEWLKG